MRSHSDLCTSRQNGSVLLESLIAVVIFSIGVLAIVGMQAFAVSASSDAKYRNDANFLANQLLGSMWGSDRTQAVLQAAFASPSGTAYTTWAWGGAASTGTQTAPAAGTVLGALPGAQANPPTVVITPNAATTPPSSLVTITIFWQSPRDQAPRNHSVVSQIGG